MNRVIQYPPQALSDRQRLIQVGNALKNMQRRLDTTQRKVSTLKLMMRQFQVQCNSLPEGDPVRQVIESFIGAVDKICSGE